MGESYTKRLSDPCMWNTCVVHGRISLHKTKVTEDVNAHGFPSNVGYTVRHASDLKELWNQAVI